ncbi:MAG: sigma-54 dependent transcriptional regulator [Cytophagales bacterium]|nr:sigma-54 dependent transcriptional regulator [Cytophagales bacterium]
MAEKDGNILIVDDKVSVLNSLELFLKLHFNRIFLAKSPSRIPKILEEAAVDVVLLDMNFAAGVNTGNEGLFWLRKIKEQNERIEVVFITAYGDVDLAVKAVKEGATDFVLKPWDNYKLLTTLRSALKLKKSKDRLENAEQKQKHLIRDINKPFECLIGESTAMKGLIDTIGKIAKTDASVLITGENGTGKELVAREIHRRSNRNKNILMSVDLGSITESLFEAELFGHVKGAYTDARESRIGRFEAASGGSLFLDEIGNLALALQAKLLTAIEQKEISPVGSNRKIPLDFRLICATNKNLSQLVEQELFREDLLYRINTITLEIPPLRERKEDILQLADHFLKRFKTKYEKGNIRMISDKALRRLCEHHWPGNVRELMHAMEKAVILCEQDSLSEKDLPVTSTETMMFDSQYPLSLEEGEQQLIINALRRNQWNISETARELKIGRQTLYRKIDKYDLS